MFDVICMLLTESYNKRKKLEYKYYMLANCVNVLNTKTSIIVQQRYNL